MLNLTDMEDLLLSRIKEQLPYVVTVESYQGQIKEDMAETVIRTPAVLALLKNTVGSPSSFGEYSNTYKFNLIVVCRNLRSRQAARREEGGVYQILEDLRQALTDFILDPELQPVSFEQEEAFFVTKEWAIYFASYSCQQEWNTEES